MPYSQVKSLCICSAMVFAASSAQASDPLQVAGSSTVYPYAAMSADAFVENHDFAYPEVEAGGSSTGLRMFCEGTGADTLDIALASRRIKASEVSGCASNGVNDIIEVRIGYDGLVFANSADNAAFSFVPADWYNALAAQVVINGQLTANSASRWSEVNATLPDVEIVTYIPSSKHGTREVFDLKMLLEGCKATGAYDAFMTQNGGDRKAASASCMSLRDGGYAQEQEGGATEILDRIRGSQSAIGVVSLGFYETNASALQASLINGVAASADNIASGTYPVSRPLFMYVKQANIEVTPGIKEYVLTVLSDEMSGPDGFLTLFGLVSDPELQKTREKVINEERLGAEG